MVQRYGSICFLSLKMFKIYIDIIVDIFLQLFTSEFLPSQSIQQDFQFSIY